MRLSIAALLLALATHANAEIYTYTDAQGNKVFTNEPPAGVGATPVELPPMNTMDAPASVDADTPAPDAVSVDGQSLPYSRLQLTNIPDDEAMRANNGTFTVQVQLTPPLRQGNSLRLLLDGHPYGSPTNVPMLQLTNVDRGEHTLAVQVVAGDKLIQQSPPVTFTVQRVALGTSKSIQPPPKPRP